MPTDDERPAVAPVPETLRALVARVAHEILNHLQRGVHEPEEAQITIHDGSWSIEVRVRPACQAEDEAKQAFDLTACELAVIDVMRGRHDYVTGERVQELLEDAGSLHGASTVRHALAHLVELKILGNKRRAPRGYWLTLDPAS